MTMNRNHRTAALLSLLFLGFLSPAQTEDVSLEASVAKNEITMDEQLMLFVTVKGSVANVPTPSVPALPSFDVYSTGRSQNVSIVNGQMSSSVTFTYVLMPKAPGRYTIPPIQMSLNGKTLATQPINIGVGAAPAQASAPPVHHAAPSLGDETAEGVMLRAHVDKRRVAVQEQVTLTLQFLRRVRFLSRPSYTPPDLTGWMSYDLKPTEYTTTIHGLGYSVTEFKYALFPTSPGKLTIGSATLQCSVENFQADPFDVFFQNFFQAGETKTLRTNPITVEVAPLPESGKPSPFSGSVGHYTLSAELEKKSVKAGEPVTLTLEVKGEGNVKTIGEPQIPQLPAFRRYETIMSLNIRNSGDKVTGSKAFKTVLVPEQVGNFSIGPVKFNYYDPAAKRYMTLQSNPLALTVLPGSAPAPAAPFFGSGRPAEEVQLLKQDIRYLKPNLSTSLEATGAAPANPWIFLILNGFPLILVAGAGWVRFNKDRELRNPAIARSRKALSKAKTRLKIASQHIQDNDPNKFLGHLFAALSGYVADKLGLSAQGLSLWEAREHLKTRGVRLDNLETLQRIWEEADFGRFAPGNMSLDQKNRIHDQTLELLSRLEKELK